MNIAFHYRLNNCLIHSAVIGEFVEIVYTMSRTTDNLHVTSEQHNSLITNFVDDVRRFVSQEASPSNDQYCVINQDVYRKWVEKRLARAYHKDGTSYMPTTAHRRTRGADESNDTPLTLTPGRGVANGSPSARRQNKKSRLSRGVTEDTDHVSEEDRPNNTIPTDVGPVTVDLSQPSTSQTEASGDEFTPVSLDTEESQPHTIVPTDGGPLTARLSQRSASQADESGDTAHPLQLIPHRR